MKKQISYPPKTGFNPESSTTASKPDLPDDLHEILESTTENESSLSSQEALEHDSLEVESQARSINEPPSTTTLQHDSPTPVVILLI